MGMEMAKKVIKSESQSKHFKDLTQAAQGKLRCLMGITEEGEKGNKKGERKEGGTKEEGRGRKGD